jgi:hypothetical protein
LHHDGKGVQADNVMAGMWTMIAASHGNKDAIENSDKMSGWLTPQEISQAKDAANHWKPDFSLMNDCEK